MSDPIQIQFKETALEDMASREGVIAIFADEDGKLDAGARKINTLSRKAVARLVEGDAFQKSSTGTVTALAYPAGLAAVSVLVCHWPKPTAGRRCCCLRVI